MAAFKQRPSIPVIDVDLSSDTSWSSALRLSPCNGSKLLTAFNKQGEGVIGSMRWSLLKLSAGALHSLLGSHYEEEINDLADHFNMPARDVLLANAAYDISNVGCSTIAAATPNGPLHARNLDWEFPRSLLKKHLVVARMKNGPCGDYAAVTWPGLFGVITGVAPGRFSITVNFVRSEEESGYLGLPKRAALGYWPVSWAVRRAFDEAKDFNAAVKLLKSEFLLSPVLLTVVGTKNDERVVIERGCDRNALRKATGGEPLLVTNHYVSGKLSDDNVDLEDWDTCERLEALERKTADKQVTVDSAFKVLSSSAIFADDTQHQVVMQPKTGQMIVRVPGGATLDLQL